jgi:hypothetical protein
VDKAEPGRAARRAPFYRKEETMSYSLCLFTVSWLTAQQPAPLPASPPVQASAEIILVGGTEETPPPQPRLLDRIRNFFTWHRDEPAKVQPENHGQVTVTTKRPAIEMSAKELEKVGHDKDYAWITGKLARVAGGRWVVHYAGPYEVDRYEGCVMLAPRADLTNFHEGDLVCVVGKVLPTRAPQPQAGAVYEASEVNLIERAKR